MTDRLATGGAVCSLRHRGYSWSAIARALELPGGNAQARRLAVGYLVATGANRVTHADAAGDAQAGTVTQAPDETERKASGNG